jgi:single-stranded DNA-binding protein
MNLVVLSGTLSSDPVERDLPSGARLRTYEITTPSPGAGPADTVPAVWFDPPGRGPTLAKGDAVVVVGRVRRRFSRTAGAGSASRTEVVVERLVTPRPAARLERVLADARALLVG